MTNDREAQTTDSAQPSPVEQNHGNAEPWSNQFHELTEESRSVWDKKAEWWDAVNADDRVQRFGPIIEPLIHIAPGERVLEIACGNGWLARRLAQLGANVVATDFSPEFLRLAKDRTSPQINTIEYRLLDATNEKELLALGPEKFDAAVCIFGLMDMATIEPLMRALSTLLKSNGRFVFMITHPCFYRPDGSRIIEEEEQNGELKISYSVKVSHYLTASTTKGIGIIGEPLPHTYFNRPLTMLLEPAFEAGFAVNGLVELPAPPPKPGELHKPGSWAYFQEIPWAMVVRLQLIGR